jgi:hypothetical protein
MRITRAEGAARGVLILVCAATLTGGCGTPTRDEFKTFARAGSAYAGAVDRLLLAAGAAQVDSTSWTLALEKQTTGMDEKTYASRNEADVSRLEQISRLRRHAQLLGRYFSLAESLATSDDPAKTQAALDGVVSRLSDLKQGAGAGPGHPAGPGQGSSRPPDTGGLEQRAEAQGAAPP